MGRRFAPWLGAFIVVFVAGYQVLMAQEGAERPAPQLQEQRSKLNQTIKKEDSILEAMEAMDQAIQDQEAQLESLRLRQAEVEARTGELEQERQTLEVELAKRRVYLQKRLRALYKYSSRGFFQAMLSGGSGNERLKRIRYLQQIVRRDMALLESQRVAIDRLSEIKATLETERAQVKVLTRQVEAQVTAAQEERERKQDLLVSIRQERTVAKRVLKEMERAASALAREVEALPMASPTRGSSKEPVDGASAKSATGQGQAAPRAPAVVKTFESQRGQLGFPVKLGKITKVYGRYQSPGMKAYEFHRGLDITAPSGTPIRAIFGGEVKLAKWFKGYGQLLIIDHGQGYHSIYAHASKMFKKAGDVVKSGEKIGLVGDTGSFQGPYLYLEIRKEGKAVNPIEWLRVPPDAMQLQ